MKATTNFTYLKCVKSIDACPELDVGDIVWSYAREIWEGGYEYVVARRVSDGKVIKFRVSHLEDCFELEKVEEERCI